MDERLKILLEAMGYKLQEGDAALLELCTEKATQGILNLCAMEAVPEELEYVVLYRAAGEFLAVKNATGTSFEGVDLSASGAVKSITEGDTTVTYAVADKAETVEERLARQIEAMRKYGVGEVARFRCLKW